MCSVLPAVRTPKPAVLKVKVKITLEQATKPQTGSRGTCTLSLTSVPDGVGDQRHVPAALPPGKTRYPLYRWPGGPQGWPGRVWKISLSPGFDLRTVQPVMSRYID
jgi:hypothetical protein